MVFIDKYLYITDPLYTRMFPTRQDKVTATLPDLRTALTWIGLFISANTALSDSSNSEYFSASCVSPRCLRSSE